MPNAILRSTTAELSENFWMFKKALAVLAADEYIPGIAKDH